MTSAQDLDGRLGEPRHGHQGGLPSRFPRCSPRLWSRKCLSRDRSPECSSCRCKRCLPPAPRPCGRTAERSTSFTWARPGVVPIDVQVDLDAEDARGVVGDVRSLAPRARGSEGLPAGLRCHRGDLGVPFNRAALRSLDQLTPKSLPVRVTIIVEIPQLQPPAIGSLLDGSTRSTKSGR